MLKTSFIALSLVLAAPTFLSADSSIDKKFNRSIAFTNNGNLRAAVQYQGNWTRSEYVGSLTTNVHSSINSSGFGAVVFSSTNGSEEGRGVFIATYNGSWSDSQLVSQTFLEDVKGPIQVSVGEDNSILVNWESPTFMNSDQTVYKSRYRKPTGEWKDVVIVD